MVDTCMKNIIDMLQRHGVTTLACCCGHNKYPMTIVIKNIYYGPLEMFSTRVIPRKKRFYIKDKQGYYYIPETVKK
jgi:hypothetical protein